MTTALKPFLARSATLHTALLIAAAFYVPSALKKSDKVYTIDFVGGPAVIQSAGPIAPAATAPDTAPARPTQQAEADSFATKKHRGVALPRPSLLQGWTDRKSPPKPSMAAGPEESTCSSKSPSRGSGSTRPSS